MISLKKSIFFSNKYKPEYDPYRLNSERKLKPKAIRFSLSLTSVLGWVIFFELHRDYLCPLSKLDRWVPISLQTEASVAGT